MVAKISGGSAGSCKGLGDYLEKELKGQWFAQRHEELSVDQVVQHIDANKRNLGQQETKFYQVIISPSEQELTHIGNDPQKLKAYTRDVMESYAQNFGKGIKSEDLVWYAKIEHSRHFSHQDRAVQTGEIKRGQPKAGQHMHVHIIVSRTENLAHFRQSQQMGKIERKNPLKLSPATNHRDTASGAVKGGFDRVGFKVATEQQFDQRFTYDRPLQETFTHANLMAKGDQEQRMSARQAVRQDEAQRLARQQQALRPQEIPYPQQAVKPVEEMKPTPVLKPIEPLEPAPVLKPVEPLKPPVLRPELSESQKDLIRRLLEKLDEPSHQGQRLRPKGPRL